MSKASPIVVPAPPANPDCNLFTLKKGSVIHRIHDQRFGAEQFNPGFGNSRFAPFEIAGDAVPTAYAATSLDCAVFETIFHDIDPTEPFKSVLWSQLEILVYSTLELTRDVDIAKLFSADLMKWGVERTQLIDTPRSTYPQTRAWSPAIHGDTSGPHGMIWTSKKYDEDKALILFGDRVATSDLVRRRSVSVTADPTTLRVIFDQANRAGIDIIR